LASSRAIRLTIESLDATGAETATIEQLCEITGNRPRTLANWRYLGIGPPFVRVGKYIEYPIRGLKKWRDAMTVTPARAATLIHGQRARRR
jgi:hypothetical protein